MANWLVSGSFYARRGTWQAFAKHCEASSAEQATEWAYSEIGGCHHVKRRQIRISTVTEESVP
jgi:ribosomal protein L20A (L18A)